MAKNNLMAQLMKLEGAVTDRHNIHATVIGTKSPSFNFLYGNGHGLPFGYTTVLYGPPKGGKSIVCNAMIADLHASYPNAVAIKFDTEMREQGQMNVHQAEVYGIDLDRYVCYSVNSPDLIFDRISKDINDLCQKGLEVRLIIIDSLTAILGRRTMNSDTIMQMQIGDLALTLQEGLKQILPVQRRHNIAVVLTAQVRAELDQLEVKRGNKTRMAASFGIQHYAEFFIFVEADRNKDAKTDLLGKTLTDATLTDMNDNEERTGYKVRMCMKGNSMGPQGRCGEFTFDFDKGIINTYEEVFLLGSNRGVIERPNQTSYEFGGHKWVGKASMIQAIRDDSALYSAILTELRKRDLAGLFGKEPEEPTVAPVPVPVILPTT